MIMFYKEYNYSTKSLIHYYKRNNFYLKIKISDYIGYHIRTPDNAEKSKYNF